MRSNNHPAVERPSDSISSMKARSRSSSKGFLRAGRPHSARNRAASGDAVSPVMKTMRPTCSGRISCTRSSNDCPLIPGIRRSDKIRSYWPRSISCHATSPDEATFTAYPQRCSICPIMSVIVSSSSTTKIRSPVGSAGLGSLTLSDCPGAASPAMTGGVEWTGNSTMKMAPCPTQFSAQMRPPCSSTIP